MKKSTKSTPKSTLKVDAVVRQVIKSRGNKDGYNYTVYTTGNGHFVNRDDGPTSPITTSLRHAYQVARDAAKEGDVCLSEPKFSEIQARIKNNVGTGSRRSQSTTTSPTPDESATIDKLIQEATTLFKNTL